MSEVYLLDNLLNEEEQKVINSESAAHIQALYSRSKQSVTEHVAKLKESGSSSFMEKYYIGYGHESVGDMGSVTIFIENVSMLTAKVLQDFPLYCGTECSSRYLDFDTEEDSFHLPVSLREDNVLKNLPDELMVVYGYVKDRMYGHLLNTTTKPESTTDLVWDKTLKARAFDVARGFLPCGTLTNLSMHVSLRSLKRRYYELLNHPLAEVRAINDVILKLLQGAYPSSFNLREVSTEVSDWNEELAHEFAYNEDINIRESMPVVPIKLATLLSRRPKYGKIPRALETCGLFTDMDVMDFSGIRDLHRHRCAYIPLPVVRPTALNLWYIDILPEEIQADVQETIDIMFRQVRERQSTVTDVDLQYVLPLGTNVPLTISADLSQIIYIIELRSSVMVHPTVRKYIRKLIRIMDSDYPKIKIFPDRSPDILDPRRGTQDIVERTTDD